MGDSHYESNIKAKDGSTVTISGFSSVSATTFTGDLTGDVTGTHTGTVSGNVTGNLTGNVDGTTVKATSYVQVGDRFTFSGSLTENSASIVAAASALVTTASLKGSIFLAGTYLWHFDATNTATINAY